MVVCVAQPTRGEGRSWPESAGLTLDWNLCGTGSPKDPVYLSPWQSIPRKHDRVLIAARIPWRRSHAGIEPRRA